MILFILKQKHLKNYWWRLNSRWKYLYFKKIRNKKNTNKFDDILMFLNKHSPLSVKAKKKYCELFYLNKTEADEITIANLEQN